MYGFYQQQPQIIGSLARVNNYAEIQSAPVPVNGSPIMFLVESEPAVYMVSQQGGQRTIQGFNITPMQTAQEATETRITNLEAAIMNIKNLLTGVVKNDESDSKHDEPAKPAGKDGSSNSQAAGIKYGSQHESSTKSNV